MNSSAGREELTFQSLLEAAPTGPRPSGKRLYNYKRPHGALDGQAAYRETAAEDDRGCHAFASGTHGPALRESKPGGEGVQRRFSSALTPSTTKTTTARITTHSTGPTDYLLFVKGMKG